MLRVRSGSAQPLFRRARPGGSRAARCPAPGQDGCENPAARAGVPARAQAVTVSSLAQCRHLVASTGKSSDSQKGQVLVGAGSPKTFLPRLRMYDR
jgi:hypothetical protein